MNKDDNGLSLEDEKISKLNDVLQKEGKQDFKSALANVGVQVMPEITENEKIHEEAEEASVVNVANETNETVEAENKNLDEENGEVESTAKSIIKSLRTYERDVADTIRGGESLVSMKIAEQKKQDEKAKTSETKEVVETVARSSLLFIISAILIFIAIITLGTTFYLRDRTKVETVVIPRTLISVDSTREISVDSLSKEKVSTAIQNTLKEKSADGSFVEISLKKNSSVGIGKTDVSSEEFFKVIGSNAPSALSRAVSEKWLLGFHNLNRSFVGELFVITKLQSFDNAYDSMLTWEARMFGDLGNTFLGEERMPTITTDNKFEDLVVKSRDTRVLKNDRGEIIILYSFIDSDHLIITTNEDTFRDIVTRYLASGLVR